MVDTSFVTLSNVTVKRRDRIILGPISMTLDDTGRTIVLGPNGAGKTTFLKVLHGIERITAGDVAWSVTDQAAPQSQAYVFQQPVMLRRSVRQNLAYPLQLVGTAKSVVNDKVMEWAEKTGLADIIDHPATRLSGGEKQKLALGRALIRGPRVLFLDEPCANLDGRSTREIERLLLDASNTGTRIIMSTHNIGQSRRLATDVVFLLNGQLHDRGDADSFFATPGTTQAKSFLEGDIVE